MTPTNTDGQNIAQAIKLMELVRGGRLVVCPEDYPPSEWKQYKQVTADMHEIVLQLSSIYMRL